MRFQDLFLIPSQCVDLGLLSITATFRTARDLKKKILGSGFEMIRISQCESPRVCGFMIKKGQSGEQIDNHNRGELRCHPEASRGGICDKNGISYSVDSAADPDVSRLAI